MKTYGNQAERGFQTPGSRPGTFLLWKGYNLRLQVLSLSNWRPEHLCDEAPVTATGPANRSPKKAAGDLILMNCSFLSSFFFFWC